MSILRNTALTGVMALAAGGAFAQGEVGPNGLPIVGGAEMSPERTIVGNAVNSADHTTLVAAVEAAGLVDTLTSPGPFTVFAPVNAAFDALPEGAVEDLLLPENKERLTQVLTCHVVAAKAMSDAIAGMIADDGGVHPVPTVGGCTLDATMDGDTIALEDENGRTATVTIADVEQSNGVIHVIDTVLLPGAPAETPADSAAADPDAEMPGDEAAMAESAPAPEAPMAAEGEMAEAGSTTAAEPMTAAAAPEPAMSGGDNPMVGGAPMLASRDIVDNAVNSADHTTLVAAVQAADLVETLKGDGPFTVFAPTNAAFEALPAGTVESLLEPANRDQLAKILTAHVVAGRLDAETIAANLGSDGFYHMETVSGDALSAQVTDSGRVFVFDENSNAHEVSIADVMQSNGVIHVVDGVLLPR